MAMGGEGDKMCDSAFVFRMADDQKQRGTKHDAGFVPVAYELCDYEVKCQQGAHV